MSMVLYQFPLSHYCEKVRWALDYKGLPYRTRNLLPGMHVKTIRGLAAASTVPVLEHDGVYIQGSAAAITHLDQHFPAKGLTPADAQPAQAAADWERYLDEEVGIHVRRYLYHTLLQHPKLVVGLLSAGSSFWAGPLMRLTFPMLERRMRRHMRIDAESAAASRQIIERALQRITESVSEQGYLVGGSFSRADLAAAALLAPMFMPPEYGLTWPPALPEPLRSEIAEMEPTLTWARQIYAQHR